MTNHHLNKLLDEGEKDPAKLFHVEMLMKGCSSRLMVDIDGDALGRLTGAFGLGQDHPVSMTDHSSNLGPRSIMVDPLEIAFLYAMEHRPKKAREK